MAAVRVLSILLCGVIGSAGCAAGYGVGYTSLKVGPTASPRAGFPEDQDATLSATFQEFRIIDSTGLLLAGLVNAGRQHNARADAIRDAQYAPRNADGTVTVEYSYEPMPIVSGLLTDMRIRLGFGGDLELPPGQDSGREVDYWAFDVRPEFYTFRPVKTLPLVASLWLSVKAENWKAADVGGIGFKVFTLDMLFGGSASYVLRNNVVATGRVGVGFISPLLAAFSGGTYLNPGLEAEIGWRPLTTNKVGVMVSAVAYYGREFAIDRPAAGPRVSLNVALTFGNQARGYKPQTDSTPPPPPPTTPTPPPPTTPSGEQPLSGHVCIGDSPTPECTQIANTAPERVKILFIACAQATLTAGQTNQFDKQPGVCKTAGEGIALNIKNGPGQPITAADQRLMRIAAAGAFDLAAAGYETSGSKLSADHCAMVEQTFEYVVGPDPQQPVIPAKVATVDRALQQCRAKYTCTKNADLTVTCTAIAPPPAPTTPAPAPPATP